MRDCAAGYNLLHFIGAKLFVPNNVPDDLQQAHVTRDKHHNNTSVTLFLQSKSESIQGPVPTRRTSTEVLGDDGPTTVTAYLSMDI